MVLMVLLDTFRRIGRMEELHGDSTVWPCSSLDQRSKMEEVVSKMACQRGSDAGQSRRR